MNCFLLTFFIFVTFPNTVPAANILVLENVPSPSHHLWIKTLLTELVLRGHNVTSISADIEPNPTPNLHYIHLEKVYSKLRETSKNVDLIVSRKVNPWRGIIAFHEYCVNTCEGILESTGLQQLLAYPDDFVFDLVLHDFIMHPCLLGFLHKFNYPPMIAVTAFNAISMSRNLIGSQFYPYIPLPFRIEFNPSFLGRTENFVLYLADQFYKNFWINPQMDQLSGEYYPDKTPPVHTLEKLTRLVLINNNPAIDDIEPMLPNVIPVGGLQIKNPKGLPKVWLSKHYI